MKTTRSVAMLAAAGLGLTAVAPPFRSQEQPRFKELKMKPDNSGFECDVAFPEADAKGNYYRMGASFNMFLIREAWERGLNLEQLADGFGPGAGTHGDWLAIRDSTDEAKVKMLEAALNHLFPAVR